MLSMEEMGLEGKGQLGFQNPKVCLVFGMGHSRGSYPSVLRMATGVGFVCFPHLPLLPTCPLFLKDHVREGPNLLSGN